MEVIRMTQSTSQLPEPSRTHATCAWCHAEFASILELLQHTEDGHLVAQAA
jgi:hypothetical protein